MYTTNPTTAPITATLFDHDILSTPALKTVQQTQALSKDTKTTPNPLFARHPLPAYLQPLKHAINTNTPATAILFVSGTIPTPAEYKQTSLDIDKHIEGNTLHQITKSNAADSNCCEKPTHTRSCPCKT